MPPTPILLKSDFFNIFNSILVPGTYFKMILGPVAPFSQSMSPWRATATHFVSKTVIFQPPQNAIICYRTPKILILGPCMYCKRRSMYCKHKYMPQRCRLYVAKTHNIFCKYRIYMLQIDMYVSQIHIFML